MLPRTILAFATACTLLGLSACSNDDSQEDTTTRTPTTAQHTEPHNMGDGSSGGPGRVASDLARPSVSGIAFDMADGSLASMDDYQGKAVLVVNVASRCGLTPQVAGLEELQKAYADRNFTVLAFPSASFNQEPLGSADAAAFCADMGATYPVAAKIDVKGEAAHPLFAALAEQGGEPSWNFTKYLVAPDGTVVARFDPRLKPTDPAVKAAIDRTL